MGRSEEKLTPELLAELIDCNAETGELLWKTRPRHYFISSGNCAYWNRRWAGKPALASLGNRGYLTGGIFDEPYTAHRVVWAMVHKKWPDLELDHINGIKTDNRIANLREIDRTSQARNMPLPRHNTSGTVGVNFSKKKNKWCAQIGINRKRKDLGAFRTKEEAIAARKAGEIKYGFHPNHGRE